MNDTLLEWIRMALRWAHVIIAIGWIGHQMMLYALEKHFRPPRDGGGELGFDKELWMAHGGRFMRLQSTRNLPLDQVGGLVWFRWGAAFTWLTGVALFILLVLSWGGSVYAPGFVAPAGISPLLFCLGALALPWLVYEGTWSSPLRNYPVLASALCVVGLVAYCTLMDDVLNGRILFLVIGGLFGSIMSSNVWLHIVPNMGRMVRMLESGQQPDMSLTTLSKNRALHIRLSHFPVLLAMISSHFPLLTGHEHAGLLLGILVIMAACLRQLAYETGEAAPVFKAGFPVSLAAVVAVLALSMEQPAPAEASTATISDKEAFALIRTHCGSCHSSMPTDPAWPAAPGGVAMDTFPEVLAHRQRIYTQAVASKIMPLGNVTGMTQEERDALGLWIRAWDNRAP